MRRDLLSSMGLMRSQGGVIPSSEFCFDVLGLSSSSRLSLLAQLSSPQEREGQVKIDKQPPEPLGALVLRTFPFMGHLWRQYGHWMVDRSICLASFTTAIPCIKAIWYQSLSMSFVGFDKNPHTNR